MSKLQTPSKTQISPIIHDQRFSLPSQTTQVSNQKSLRKNLDINNSSAMITPKVGRKQGNLTVNNAQSNDQKFSTPNMLKEPSLILSKSNKKSSHKSYQSRQNRIQQQPSNQSKDSTKQEGEKNSQVLNIRVSKSKKSGLGEPINNAERGSQKPTLEVWHPAAPADTDRTDDLNESLKYSDIADEFNYRYDPNYILQYDPKRCFSPQVRNNKNYLISQGSQQRIANNKTPKPKKRQHVHSKLQYTPSINFNEFDSDDDIIHKTCKLISHKKTPGRKRKIFIKRMEFDISKRDERDQTFGILKDNLQSRLSSPRKEKSKISQRGLSNSSQKEENTEVNQVKQLSGDNDSINQQPSARFKKLRKSECEQIFNRMMQYEERKKQSIKLLQDQKRRDEELEQITGVHQRKLNRQQLSHCYDRLTQDAMRRKMSQVKAQQEMLLKQEAEMKSMFKPQINKEFKPKRDNSNGSALRQKQNGTVPFNHQLSLEQKIEMFSNNAHSQVNLSSNRGNSPIN